MIQAITDVAAQSIQGGRDVSAVLRRSSQDLQTAGLVLTPSGYQFVGTSRR